MTNSMTFDLAGWSKLARIGSTNAIVGLSQMLNQEITISALSLDEVSLKNSDTLIGRPDTQVIGIYLLFSGVTNGQILLVFQPKVAFELIDMAMSMPPGTTTTLGEMERSVLGEMGNIVGTYFLNAVADHIQVILMPSPPAVVQDVGGAVVGSVLAEAFAVHESIFVIRLLFEAIGRKIEGKFLILPAAD
ncbi:MAG: chemotaxis protein CheC [Dehalococcoidales bacterium]|nr:chemotaxis protein CheC [Dehalococcoidales bacterium]